MKPIFNDHTPIYLQIMTHIKKQIVVHILQPGDKLPSVRELSKNLEVNPNTVQRAYQELEREEITYTQRGMGTFVTDIEEKLHMLKKEMAKDLITNFIQQMKSIGFVEDELAEIIAVFIKKNKE